LSGPQPSTLTTTPKIRSLLEKLGRCRQKSASLVRRSQLILRMLDGANNAQAARQFGVHLDTPRLWRRRWLALSPQLEKLERELEPQDADKLQVALEQALRDEPRPGTPPSFSPEQVTTIMALACSDPRQSGYSFEVWTAPDLAREAVKRGIVSNISPASISRFLKRSRP
jgi:putative transposase